MISFSFSVFVYLVFLRNFLFSALFCAALNHFIWVRFKFCESSFRMQWIILLYILWWVTFKWFHFIIKCKQIYITLLCIAHIKYTEKRIKKEISFYFLDIDVNSVWSDAQCLIYVILRLALLSFRLDSVEMKHFNTRSKVNTVWLWLYNQRLLLLSSFVW